MPQVKGNGTLASNVLLAISGTTVAERLFAWDNMSVVEDLTVGSLAGTGVRPVCVDTDHKLVICTPACGNSFIETGAGEQCDDGNTNNGDGCSSTCQNESAPVCGNNIIEGTEQCDDGNTDNGDGCSSACQNESPIGWLDLANGHFSGFPVYGNWRDINTSQVYYVETVGNPGAGYLQVPFGDYEWLGGDVTTENGCPVPSDPPDIWPAIGTIQTISPTNPSFSASVGCH